MKVEKEPVKVSVAAGVVVRKDGKYLLVQEAQARSRGKWNIPAGRVDKGETIEEAAIREALEETGYEVRLIKKLGVHHVDPTQAVKHAFAAEIIGGELRVPLDELLDVKWFSYEEIVAMKDDLRNEWVLEDIMIVHLNS